MVSNLRNDHPLARQHCSPIPGQSLIIEGTEYTLGGELGHGAAGLVHRLTCDADQSTRAIKFLAPDPNIIEISAFDDVLHRFRREGLRGANLMHPNLVKIHLYSDNENGSDFARQEIINPFIVMERQHGRTLENHIRKFANQESPRFEITRQNLIIAIQICEAVAYLHKYKLVHRDVKPANIFVTKINNRNSIPSVKIGDFGVMKWGDFHASISTGVLTTASHPGLGTMKYMSHELGVSPDQVSLPSDIFSLGVTLFELFTSHILPTTQHVVQIMFVRLEKGNTLTRFMQLGYEISSYDENIGELVLDMHLRGITTRPTIRKILGNLEYEYERRFGSRWQDDVHA